jgi:hypothetical protein
MCSSCLSTPWPKIPPGLGFVTSECNNMRFPLLRWCFFFNLSAVPYACDSKRFCKFTEQQVMKNVDCFSSCNIVLRGLSTRTSVGCKYTARVFTSHWSLQCYCSVHTFRSTCFSFCSSYTCDLSFPELLNTSHAWYLHLTSLKFLC